jgi:hypothetical protein
VSLMLLSFRPDLVMQADEYIGITLTIK